MTALLECHQYTLIVPLQYITIICQSINPDCFGKPIILLRTHHLVDAKISDGSYRYLTSYRTSHVYWYRQVSASASYHKPLHVFRIQQEVAILHHFTRILLINDVYVSQFYFNTTNKVARYTV